MYVRVTPMESIINEQRGNGIDESKRSNGTVNFDRTGPTEKSGPPRKVGPIFRNFSVSTEPIHSVLDWNFRKFWLNGTRPVCQILFSRESLRYSHFGVMWLVCWTERKQTTNTMERNVVRMWAAVSLGGAWRDVPNLIFVEMFCANLQSPVWNRHVGGALCSNNMVAGK